MRNWQATAHGLTVKQYDMTLFVGKAKDFGVTFVKPSGERVSVRAPLGDSMLEVAVCRLHFNGHQL